MIKLGRALTIAYVLTKSQLRAGRSGRGGESFFRNPAVLGAIDAAGFGLAAAAGLFVASVFPSIPEPLHSQVVTAFVEALVFVPALIPSVVLVAGVLFELSASSKFASSDAINWLPVTQAEYVTGSTLSISYTYSVVPSVIMGATLGPAVSLGYGLVWVEMLLLSCASLFYGGAIVEILRAAINRVSTAVMKRARRSALVLRLAITIALVLVLQVIFNFVLLIDLINKFASTLSLVGFVPVFWASLAIRASLAGDVGLAAAYSAATALFAGSMLWAATLVRAKYWAPNPTQVVVTQGDYRPGRRSSFNLLSLFRLDTAESTLVRKDLKGLFRRRELLQYFSIPFVLAFVFLLQVSFNPGVNASASQAPSFINQLPVWFVGGLFGLMISSIGFGQEGRTAALLYALPLTSRQVLRAKIFTALALAMSATACIFVLVVAITRPPLVEALEEIVIALLITTEEVFIGTAFGARYPDFQERPRPRFVDPLGIIAMMIVGMIVLVLTALPSILGSALVSIPGIQPQLQSLFFVSIVFATAVIGLSYRWAARETRRLFVEFRA
ncbi:MAG: hypothetical protein OK455_08145 [Thaumarchaeota archaeon]|nr:hypothetical protein [Nitrososphaerota archaeon]